MNTGSLFTKFNCFVMLQRKYVYLCSFVIHTLLNPNTGNVPTGNVTYLLRKLFNDVCLLNIELYLSDICHTIGAFVFDLK